MSDVETDNAEVIVTTQKDMLVVKMIMAMAWNLVNPLKTKEQGTLNLSLIFRETLVHSNKYIRHKNLYHSWNG